MKSSKNKILTRTTTCASIFDINELDYCFDYCKKQVDSLSHSRKRENFLTNTSTIQIGALSLGQLNMLPQVKVQ